jgi:hypothetical protein
MRTLQLGEILIQQGLITPSQRDQVLLAQHDRGGPFGALAEEMFGVAPSAVERAWASQFSSFAPRVDPRSYNVNPKALEIVSRRQAWQFRILPIDFQHDDVVACTCEEWLVKALKFAGWRLGHGVHFVLAEPGPLGEALCRYYPMGGMTPRSVLADVA